MPEVKKILHIFPESMFIDDFFAFMEKYYPNIVHDFIVTDFGGRGEATKIKEERYKQFNIEHISTFNPKDIPALSRRLRRSGTYDNIIFHSLYMNYLLIALLINKKAVCRATSIMWGIQDAGPFIVPPTKRNIMTVTFGWFYEKLRRLVIPRFRCIGTVIESEYERIKPLYNLKGVYKECKYTRRRPEVAEHSERKKSEYVNVQAGHAGHKLTNTVEALEILEKFKDENIRVYCPLSYGDEVYIDEVIKKGKEIFGRKFYPITKQMSQDKYERLLSYMDVYVHNATGQVGLGNIDINVALKNKIYMDDEGVVYNDYSVMQGYNVNKISDIKDQSFEEFVYFSPEDAEENKQKSNNLLDDDNFKRIWDNILLDYAH